MPCFTTAPSLNNEVDVARTLAQIKGSPHTFLDRSVSPPRGLIDVAVALGGGMTVYHEAQFIGFADRVAPQVDTVFLGLALDVMFCGHYLPKSLVRFGGRLGWHFRLHDLPADLETTFLETVSYRLKTSDPWVVIRADRRAEMRRQLHDRVVAEMAEGRAAGLAGFDLWEFMHQHNLARHYSLLMAQSVRTFAACRLPALTRELANICWSMTVEDKANWRVYQKAIACLSPEMMRVRNANTNIRADRSLSMQTAIRFGRAALNRLPLMHLRATPGWQDRSWPQLHQMLNADAETAARARALSRSEALAAPDLFDMDAVGRIVDDHFSGRADHAVLINLLLTIDGTLRVGG